MVKVQCLGAADFVRIRGLEVRCEVNFGAERGVARRRGAEFRGFFPVW